MQQYLIDEINPATYIIKDGDSAYMLMISHANTEHTNAQLTIAEVIECLNSASYVEFGYEIFSFRWFASDWNQVEFTLKNIIDELQNGIDISNPAELSLMFGGCLHGLAAKIPSRDLKGLN
jgi:hypothetical protein